MPYENCRGRQCVVVGCSNNQRDLYRWKNTICAEHGEQNENCICLAPFKFHCLPLNAERRREWLGVINRKDFNPASKAVVCSLHFVDGLPTKKNPLPTVNMGYEVTKTPKPRRQLVRRALMPVGDNMKLEPSEPMFSATMLPPDYVNDISYEQIECKTTCCLKYPGFCNNVPKMVEASTQTDDLIRLDHPYAYHKTTKCASTQQTTPEFSIDDISSDTDARFYTGLDYSVLMALIAMMIPFGKALSYKLNISDQILSVLMRLRLGLTFFDISRRFNISRPLVANIFHTWIDILAVKLSDCVVWLPRTSIRRTLPSSFVDTYPKTTCIIDCTEVFIQRPFTLKARNQTYSNYKSHNTAKFLVAIAPNGYIMFVSKAYGGRASDNFITKSSGFLEYLLPGDEVMADRGFTIGEELCARQVKLNIPAFMKGRTQLSAQETIASRRIASVRIHVERAINRLKCFRILSTTLNIKSTTKLDKKMRVIAALCNLQGSLIRENTSED
ncbi:uncharacterized protein LOC127837749 [Dreissena polymorpha]|uniref:uncharacterized protein LOC127837749 n=1 Tax=Dreissena polymorpha TaxID=45954 RepID=UPI00226443DD|nr:uncharacterized protein LOC127837749 [Dreissena polymorpha]